MSQKISETKIKKQLRFEIINLINLWETLEEKGNPDVVHITEIQKDLEKLTGTLKKYSINS